MRGWCRDLAELAVPAECAGCGRPHAVLCDRCASLLLGSAARRVRPVPVPPGLPPVYAAAGYRGAVRSVLLAHKERGALPLARPLGAALAAAVLAALRSPAPETGESGERGSRRMHGHNGDEACPLLVPVPSARRSVAARGHDPTRRMALAAAGRLRSAGLPVRVTRVLRQRREVADQAGLNARQRLANLTGALEAVAGAGRLLHGGPVVLVDDLLTTGASLTEAARAVTAAGGRVHAAAVVAAPGFPGLPGSPGPADITG